MRKAVSELLKLLLPLLWSSQFYQVLGSTFWALVADTVRVILATV